MIIRRCLGIKSLFVKRKYSNLIYNDIYIYNYFNLFPTQLFSVQKLKDLLDIFKMLRMISNVFQNPPAPKVPERGSFV